MSLRTSAHVLEDGVWESSQMRFECVVDNEALAQWWTGAAKITEAQKRASFITESALFEVLMSGWRPREDARPAVVWKSTVCWLFCGCH